MPLFVVHLFYNFIAKVITGWSSGTFSWTKSFSDHAQCEEFDGLNGKTETVYLGTWWKRTDR